MNAIQRFGKTKLFRAMFKNVAPTIDRVFYKLTGRTVASLFVPTFIVVNTGRKSGKEYRTPLGFIDDGDRFLIMGSNWGQTHHPAWTANLMANPDTFVELKGERIAVRARLLSDEEKAAVWPRFTEIWPAYDTYVERAGGRNLRCFALEKR